MKKLLAILMAALLLTACSSGGDEPADDYTDTEMSEAETTEEPDTADNEYAGNWFIQGVSDSYCLTINGDDTWTLCFPGKDGDVVCEGICDTDPFGDYNFYIDRENGVSLGSGYLEEGGLWVGVSSTSPCQLEPFGDYKFYPEEMSEPRISAGDYTGWWKMPMLGNPILLSDDGTWAMKGTFEDDDVGGTWELSDDGIVINVERSNSMYFSEGDELEFTVQEDGSVFNSLTGYTYIPDYEE